jgi:hypothetical protein
MSSYYEHASIPSSYLSSFREVAQELSALLVTLSPHYKVESSCAIATERDNVES